METSMVMETERQYLRQVLEYLKNHLPSLEEQKIEVDSDVAYGLRHYNDLNPDQFIALNLNLNLQAALAQKLLQGSIALDKPYFARVDFASFDEKLDEGLQAYYIGKMSLMRDMEMLITDWRAPVASLYYEGRIGTAGYDCPDGYIEGEISLKRQYQIEQGELENFSDIDITTNDTFLQAALGASKDRRLKDIVTTIQAEQNKVIRAPLFKPLIVQGAAGSGKTTIALHRIAYLLYNYDKHLLPKNVMIMAPNRFFLSYISEVLPDLGVDQVTQTTFIDFVSSCINFPASWKIAEQMEAVSEVINKGEYQSQSMEVASLKSDLRFLKLVKRYVAKIERDCLPDKGFIVEGYELFTHEAIVDLFLNTYNYLPVDRRAKEIEKNLNNTLKKEIPLILAHLEADYDRRREDYKRQMPDSQERRNLIIALLDERDAILATIKKKSRTELKKYIRTFKLKTTLQYYQALFEDMGNAELYEGLYTIVEWESISTVSAQDHKRKRLSPEDLPPLLWLQTKLFGLEDSDIKHIVIDEAQDASLFQLAALRQAMKSDSFTILGDLHQGILSHKGIRDWNDVARLFKMKSDDILTIKQSYRTTVEIMDAANPVIAKLYPEGTEPIVPLAVPVIRHGSPVTYTDSQNIAETVAEWQSEGLRSIAIIGKTIKDCKNLQKLINAPIISEAADEYEGGILIVPSYLVKGLEFDGVIVADAKKYKLEEALDVKLLYIAMTRALHRLEIIE